MNNVAVFLPRYFFPSCEITEKLEMHSWTPASDNDMNMDSGTHMTCWYTAEGGTGALVILVGLVLPNRDSHWSRGILAAGLGIVTVLLPIYLIGRYSSFQDTPCNIGTKPAGVLIGALTVVTGIYLGLERDEPLIAPV